MTKLELLSVFLNDRLTAAAEEIFRAVKDTVAEYQSEILRSKEDNERLKRLLNAAVQRLRQQPEPLSVQPLKDGESECGGSVEPQIKEEPTLRNIQTDGSQEARDSDEGNCSHAEEEPAQRTKPPPGPTACLRRSASPPPPLTPRDMKAESPREDGGGETQTVHPPHRRAAPSSFCPGGAKSPRPQKAEQQQVRGLLRSNGKQILQIKNVRSLKSPPLPPPPPPCSTHPGQGAPWWHSCKECGKCFSFACQLKVHMRWHTKEKPYSCAVCRKSFTTVSMLKRHHRIHTGEKPFRCHVCGKCFNQSAHLNTHLRLHARERAGWGRAALS